MRSLDYTEAVVFVTRQYHWLVEPLITLTDKHLGIPLNFLSDRPIDVPEGHKVTQCFPKDCKLYSEPCGKYIKDAIYDFHKPLLLFFFADFLLQKKVDFDKLRILELYMLKHADVARGNLYSGAEAQIKGHAQEHPEDIVKYQEIDIVKLPKSIGQIGSTSLLPAMWSREFILEFMGDNWQLDHIELPGQHEFEKQSKWHSIGTVPALFDIAHLCYTSDLEMARLTQMKEEDREIVRPHIPKNFKVEE